MNQKPTPPPLPLLEQAIVEEFDQLPSIDEKYQHLFKLGDALPALENGRKNDDNLIKGCQSTVWFFLNVQDNNCSLQADSDSMLIKGISALLVRLVEGRTIEELAQINLNFLDKMGIWKLASRANPGLNAIVDHLHRAAESQPGAD